jgi:methionyl-tRNA formyltransferase
VYLVAGSKTWNRQVYDEVIARLPGEWHFIAARQQLTTARLRAIRPRFIFFLHWSWKVPDEIADNYECVCFHMTDVPYGRGGSPLQNLIVRGHRATKLSALRMVHEVDAGPVYLKEELSLKGSARDIYLRATRLSAQMIGRIIRERPEPVPQAGNVVVFKRRRPEESLIAVPGNLEALYDFIRMLDAEGYPKAFIVWHGFRLEFSRAALYNGRVEADVTITKCEEER